MSLPAQARRPDSPKLSRSTPSDGIIINDYVGDPFLSFPKVLLISGGENLQRDVRVCSYNAGTDTNPIFLFSKCLIESSVPPSVAAEFETEDNFKVSSGLSYTSPGHIALSWSFCSEPLPKFQKQYLKLKF